MAAISAMHARIDGVTVGSHTLVSRFLKGVRRLRPPRRNPLPSWDLSLVLAMLRQPPFEPLETAELSLISMKTAFLLAMASAKRVGELHAFSVSPDCLQWHPEGTGVTLWPNPSFLPKCIPLTYVNQPLTLMAFSSPDPGAGPANMLCPVRALRLYIDKTADFRLSDALFVCYGGSRRGGRVSKQRLSKWIVSAITLAYSVNASTAPSRVRCHSTRSVAASWAALKGVPLVDVCSAASWSSACTFTRFYSVNVASRNPVATAVLASPGRLP